MVEQTHRKEVKLCQSAPLTSSKVNGADFRRTKRKKERLQPLLKEKEMRKKKMSCYHPITAYKVTDLRDNVNTIEFWEKKYPQDYISQKKIQLPCGKCVGCRLEYSRQWAMRIMEETKYHDEESNWFITLTYSSDPDEESRIRGKNGYRINLKTGELEEPLCLLPDDLSKFMKDLRRYYEYHYDEKNIKFYATGEYGDETQRPHYHICIFGLKNHSLMIPFFKNKLHQQIYLWPEIEQIWGHGQISVGKVSFESAAYTARYVMKKRKGKDSKEYYDELAITPEFVRMSRKPGIGREYYEDNKKSIYENDQIIFTGSKNKVMKLKPPKYYDRLYDLDNPKIMAAIKEEREWKALQKKLLQRKKTSLSEEDQLKVDERKKLDQIKALKRKL